MARSDIVKGAEYQPTAIGSKVYAWSPGGAKPPADRSRSCVISAHGVESFITSKFGKPKQVSLVYYCPHGWNLSETPVQALAKGELKPKERIPGKVACQDYALTKLQGSGQFEHETYGFIQTGMHRKALETRTRNRNVLTKENISFQKKFQEDYFDTLANNLEEQLGRIRDPIHDVITIRDRAMFSSPTLFEVIGLLEKAGFHYGDVHCGFCRGFAAGGSSGWSPAKQNA